MKVLLVRVKPPLGLSVVNLIKVEPLELEYLAAVCRAEKAECRIYDGMVTRTGLDTACRNYCPDLVAFSGYVNTVTTIKYWAGWVKQHLGALVAVGGVHAELNPTDYYCMDIDVIVYSGGALVFRQILQAGLSRTDHEFGGVAGIHYRSGTDWLINPPARFKPNELPLPDRSHFNRYRRQFHYLGYSGVALLKTSYGCPYQCGFCYCRQLNGGHYVCRSIEQVGAEVAGIEAETIWIVDDLFLFDIRRLEAFAREMQQRKIHKKWLIYSRADWIAGHEEYLPLLKQLGVVEVIVGLEAASDEYLSQYHKDCVATENEECVRLLQKYGISCTGLFVIPLEATWGYFQRIWQWISRVKLDLATFSIFTPLPGTSLYEEYRSQLYPRQDKKMDFLHLTLAPVYLTKTRFYLYFYWLHFRVFLGKPGWEMIRRLI